MGIQSRIEGTREILLLHHVDGANSDSFEQTRWLGVEGGIDVDGTWYLVRVQPLNSKAGVTRHIKSIDSKDRVVLLSESLVDAPRSHVSRSEPTVWMERLRDRFDDRLVVYIGITEDAPHQIPEINRTLSPGFTPIQLQESLRECIRTVEYCARPPRRQFTSPVVVREIRERSEIEQAFRLRFEVYRVMGYFDERVEALAARMEVDASDERSAHLGAFVEEGGQSRLIGTSRIILAGIRRGPVGDLVRKIATEIALPRDRMSPLFLDLPIFQSQRVSKRLAALEQNHDTSGELSRVIVHRDYRGTGLSRLLIDASLLLAKNHRLDWVFLECLPRHARLYEGHGFQSMPGKSGRVVHVNRKMEPMELRLPRFPEDAAFEARRKLFAQRKQLCACRQPDCHQSRYELASTDECPLVAAYQQA